MEKMVFSEPLWPWLCKRVCNVIMSGGEERLWQGTVNSLIDACHANMTHLTHRITSYRGRLRSGASVCRRERASACKYERSKYCMHAHSTFPPRVETDRLFAGCDPLPMLFVFRVTCCPLTPDPWPLTLVRQPADTSTELTAPKAHWPQKQRDREEEREREAKLWPPTSLGGGALYAQREWQFTCSKRSWRERETQISFMKYEKQS